MWRDISVLPQPCPRLALSVFIHPPGGGSFIDSLTQREIEHLLHIGSGVVCWTGADAGTNKVTDNHQGASLVSI